MNCKILIGEDDLEDQLILQDYFIDKGINQFVTFQKNGREIIEYLEREVSEEHLPKLIVLDLNMPILNGTQTLFEVKQDLRFRDIPIVIYSTSTNEHERRKCLSFGAVDYFVKPVTLAEGDLMVREFIRLASIDV